MSILSVINDTHIGVIRSGGTTPASAYALRQEVLKNFREVLAKCKGTDVLINGDLFDTSSVPYADLWEAWEILKDFEISNPESTIWCARGNHDIARNETALSSFDLFCRIMGSTYSSRFITVAQPLYIEKYDAYVIPHLQNQDIFNEAVSKVPRCSFLFLHCNYDNKFAAQSDHSLNLAQEQAAQVPAKHLVFGHEHQAKAALGGKVIITGNQICTSVADCLGNDAKFFLQVGLDRKVSSRDGTSIHPDTRKIKVWQSKGDFDQQDWRSLQDTGARFIRVIGNATYAEAAEVVSAISKFRSKSEALVITNAVVVEGTSDQAELEITAEKMAAFDVKAALFSILDPEEVAVVTELLEDVGS
jgi:DNA repair exonuclease SbcCD nuclease subunit